MSGYGLPFTSVSTQLNLWQDCDHKCLGECREALFNNLAERWPTSEDILHVRTQYQWITAHFYWLRSLSLVLPLVDAPRLCWSNLACLLSSLSTSKTCWSFYCQLEIATPGLWGRFSTHFLLQKKPTNRGMSSPSLKVCPSNRMRGKHSRVDL